MKYAYLLLPFALLFITACENDGIDDDGPLTPSFDRQAMLASWADDRILPALENFRAEAATFATLTTGDASREELSRGLRELGLAWQRAATYPTGPAEQLFLIRRINTYPTDTERIANDIETNPSANILPDDAVGLPALDYYINESGAANTERIITLAADIERLAAEVTEDWMDTRDAYVANSGNNALASVDRTVNDVINYYERDLRAGKLGIPAGVFSNAPQPDRAEFLYDGTTSGDQLHAAVLEFERFVASDGEFTLTAYLDALDVTRNGEPLSANIETAFAELTERTAALRGKDIADQVRTNNDALLATYDSFQRLLVLLKVDMMQALNINIDYVDTDGD